MCRHRAHQRGHAARRGQPRRVPRHQEARARPRPRPRGEAGAGSLVINTSIHLVVFQLRIGSSAIVRSYAKIPVEIKNMMPSNVAYQQLYDV